MYGSAKPIFWENKKENISNKNNSINMSSAEFAVRLLKVNISNERQIRGWCLMHTPFFSEISLFIYRHIGYFRIWWP